MKDKVQKVIRFEDGEIIDFCGRSDAKLKQLQSRLKARIVARGDELRISGIPGDVEKAYHLINDLLEVQRRKRTPISAQQIHAAATRFDGDFDPKAEARGTSGDADTADEADGDELPRRPRNGTALREVFLETIPVPLKRKHVAPLTPNQKKYIEAIRKHDIVFAVGPAGTGKTYLAVAMAVASLMAGQVGRIILVRPAVEAGEKLGFLPGDIAAKFDPYVRPLYDALHEMIETEKLRTYIENGIIEIAPLAFMRGRTLNNSFIILDEAQNTSIEQMKMFLTRMGFDSRTVITGDVTQVDLPSGKKSGLVHARQVLMGTEGIAFAEFSRQDVVRHPLVQKIIQAYEGNE